MTEQLAATLAGSVAGSALLVGALLAYARWQRQGDALALVTSSFAAGLAGLARYDLFVAGWALAFYTLLGPRLRPGSKDERPAYAVAYAAAVTGLFGLWLLTALLVTGSAFGYVGRAPAPPILPIPRIASEALLVLAAALALAAAAVVSRRAVAPAIATAALAAWACVAAIVSDSWLSLDAVLPLVPLGALLFAHVVKYPLRQVTIR